MRLLILFLLFSTLLNAQVAITALPELNEAPATTDVFPIVDLSATTTKKLTVNNLFTTPVFNGVVGFGATPSPAYQLFVSGAGQATINPTDAGNKLGTLFLKDTGASVNNGGMVLFGASQGFFAGIKGAIQNGSNNTSGQLHFLTRAVNTDTQLTSAGMISAAGNLHFPPTASGSAKLNIGGTNADGIPSISITSTHNTQSSSTFGVRHLPVIPGTNTQNITGYVFQSSISTGNGNASTGGEQNGFGCFHEGTDASVGSGLFCGDFHVMRDTGAAMNTMIGLEIGMHHDVALSTSFKNYGLHLWNGAFSTVTSPVISGSAINIEGSWTWPLSYYASGLNNKHNVVPTTGINTAGTIFAPIVGAGTSNATASGAVLHSRHSSAPVFKSERTTALTTSVLTTAEFELETSGNMADGFGPALGFSFQDDTITSSSVAQMSVRRAGADNTADFAFSTSNAGSLALAMKIRGTGGVQHIDKGSKPTCDSSQDGVEWYDTTTHEICINEGGGYAWTNLIAGAGGGTIDDDIEVEDGDNLGTFTAVNTTAQFEDSGDINFVLGGAGNPHQISGVVRADSVALTTDTTGNYAAGDAEAGNALSGDNALNFFSAGTFEDARISQSSVTQHQAALSITESQISDLQAYLLNVDDDATPTFNTDLGILDGVGDTPVIKFTPQTGTVWDILVTDSDDDFQISSNTASTENVDIINLGAGVANLTVEGTVTGTTAVSGPNVTSGANPGHTHDGTSISNLDTADTTTGTFADARISASSVTQHETSLEAVLDLPDLQGSVTDAQVPNNITIDLATTATTANNLAANGLDALTEIAGTLCGTGQILEDQGASWACIATPASGGAHNILSTTHTDATTQTVSRGSIIYGNATPAWDELVIGGTNTVLGSDGTDAAWVSITDAMVPNNITIDLATTATTANNLAANGLDATTEISGSLCGTNEILEDQGASWACIATPTGGGSGDAIEIEDGDNLGTFTSIDTTARFDDGGDINFIFSDGGAGGPDIVTATVRADSVALTTDTTGDYVGSVADGTGIDGTASGEGSVYTPTLDLTEINDHTWGNNTDVTIQLTFDPSGATQNPRIDFSDAVIDLITTNLRLNGSATTGTGGLVRDTLPTLNRAIVTGASFPVLEVDRTTAGTNFIVGSLEVKATSSGDIVSGFGTALDFTFQDTGGEFASVARISGIRTSADNTTDIGISTSNAGTLLERFRVVSDGSFILEGTGADDAFEYTLTGNPSADRTLTWPDNTGTFLTTGSAAGAYADASVLAADLETDLRDMYINFNLENPATADSGKLQQQVADACIIQEVECNVAAATSVTINLFERARATPETGTTGMLTSDLVCDTNGENTTSFADNALAKDVPLALGITAVSGTPSWLRVHVRCRR